MRHWFINSRPTCSYSIAECLSCVHPSLRDNPHVVHHKLGWSAFNVVGDGGKPAVNPLFGMLMTDILSRKQATILFDAAFGDAEIGYTTNSRAEFPEASLIADIIRFEYSERGKN
jgi:hypothetical protein